jgi:hydrogenase nickel incorporation protein HypA/HybF
MHELSIAEALIEQVERELHRAGQRGPVKRLELTVGRLSGVHAPSLRFAFELIAPGTVVAGARLDIAESAAVCCCRHCGGREKIEELVAECPKCGSAEISIEEGRELLLQSIEIDE